MDVIHFLEKSPLFIYDYAAKTSLPKKICLSMCVSLKCPLRAGAQFMQHAKRNLRLQGIGETCHRHLRRQSQEQVNVLRHYHECV